MHVSNDDFNIYDFLYEDVTTEDIEETIQALQGACQKATDRNSQVRGEINGLAHEILMHLEQMRKRGDSPKKIYSYAKTSLYELQTAKERFDATNSTFAAKSADFDAKYDQLQEKLSKPLKLTPLPEPAELMANNPFWADRREEALQNIVLAQLGARALKSTGNLLLEWFQESQQRLAAKHNAWCNESPGRRQMCNQAAELATEVGQYLSEKGSAILHTTGLPEVCAKVHAFFQTKNTALAHQLEQQYLIPQHPGQSPFPENCQEWSCKVAKWIVPEMPNSASYEKDSMLLLPFILPYGTLARVARLPFTAMSTITTKSFPKAVGNSIRHVYKALESHPTTSIDFMILRAEDQIQKAMPRFHIYIGGSEHRALSLSEGGWFKAIEKNKKISLQGASVEYFKNAEHFSVAKITTKGSNPLSLVVKENAVHCQIFSELVGNHFLNSLNLRHMRIAEPVAVGLTNGESKAFIAKTYLPGKTFEELFTAVGAQAFGSKDRHSLFLQLRDAAHGAGSALGELQSKAMGSQATAILPRESMNMVHDFHYKIGETERFLTQIGMPHHLPSEAFEKIINPFLKDPGPLAYGFIDVSGGRQFVWDPLHEIPFGFVDYESVAKTFTTAGKATNLIGRDYAAFKSLFNADGFIANLMPQETALLQDSFAKGYAATYKGTRSAAAESFFELYAALDTIEVLADKVATFGKNAHIEQILSKKLLPEFSRNYETRPMHAPQPKSTATSAIASHVIELAAPSSRSLVEAKALSLDERLQGTVKKIADRVEVIWDSTKSAFSSRKSVTRSPFKVFQHKYWFGEETQGFWAGKNLCQYSYYASRDCSQVGGMFAMHADLSDVKEAFVLIAHGSPESVTWQTKKFFTPDTKLGFPANQFKAGEIVNATSRLGHRSLAKLIQKHPQYKKGQPVLLMSCSVGKYQDGLAQRLANKLGTPVEAPSGIAWNPAVFIPAYIVNTPFSPVANFVRNHQWNALQGKAKTFYPGEWHPRLIRVPHWLFPNAVLFGGAAVAYVAAAYGLAKGLTYLHTSVTTDSEKDFED